MEETEKKDPGTSPLTQGLRKGRKIWGENDPPGGPKTCEICVTSEMLSNRNGRGGPEESKKKKINKRNSEKRKGKLQRVGTYKVRVGKEVEVGGEGL